MAFQGDRQLPVTDVLPLQGDHAALEFYILIDERLNPNQQMLFDGLRRFAAHMDPATSVGIAYMYNGEVRIAQVPTPDHDLAVRALQASAGTESAGANPYTSQPTTPSAPAGLRREVLMVTDGMDRFEDIGDSNMFINEAVADAESAGVLVYSLYAPAQGPAADAPALIHWGRTYLAELAGQTGGEACTTTPLTPEELDGCFASLTRSLRNQYRVTFLAEPGAAVQPISFEARGINTGLVAAREFFMPEAFNDQD
jgi:hypothetical protein